VNKRIVRHILFWVTYFIVNTLFEFSWIQSFFPNTKHEDLINQAILTNVIIIPSKLLFTYFVFFFTIPRAFNKTLDNTANMVITTLVFVASIFFHRILATALLFWYPSFSHAMKLTFSEIFSISQLFASMLDLGFICGVAIVFKLFRMQLSNISREKDLSKEKLETELKFLKNQINPHFLFNTLNNIYALARKKSDLAPVIIMKLSKLLRFMLYEAEKSHVPISEEIRVLEDYVEVEKVRFSKRLHITFTQDIDNQNQAITPLILLPFIENAFKHGPGEMLSDTFIDINIMLENGYLSFAVTNSKEAKECESVAKKIGLSNVRRQLELMYTEFKLDIENLSDTFKINLSINLNKNAAV
jgi:two-component system LytT family sensor kinase